MCPCTQGLYEVSMVSLQAWRQLLFVLFWRQLFLKEEFIMSPKRRPGGPHQSEPPGEGPGPPERARETRLLLSEGKSG